MSTNQPSTALTSRQQLAVVVVAAAVVGAVLAPSVYAATNDPEDTVAVVEIEGPVNTALADDVESELADIRANDSVGAVVLKLDTPGGAPVASERMYKAVQRTSEQMTVIASVQSISASGGYYAMAPADEIYVLPTSTVGSIGLNAPAPRTTAPVQGPSGPDKAGGNAIQTWAEQETLADTFVDAMMAERGDEFQMPREEVAQADVYLGTEAVDNGFADEIGSLNEAIHAAATAENMGEYRVDTRETGPDFGFPILLRTDTQVVAVYANDPGYGEVEPMGLSYVHRPAVPHVDTVERFSESDLAVDRGGSATRAGGTSNETARLTGGVGA
ncbi:MULTISPECIES: S49 family peptidase [unclassified Halorubrum]|uniref:S49 family peptidase n=1 Tax=unclassified Halorubrum TaxID=2642239 RepID=UPI000B99B036|nr:MULTISPECIES: S49 family peptidase [unclassified Halorubrum]OYR46683.1 signal peptide peptidase [Halorubrum sp. Hd13]OYR52667.1 signal peptide peptidase [Halorubrum sp. Ea8]OYR53298.1 signal peptide peptidase [Halorubrum sp. Ea1]